MHRVGMVIFLIDLQISDLLSSHDAERLLLDLQTTKVCLLVRKY